MGGPVWVWFSSPKNTDSPAYQRRRAARRRYRKTYIHGGPPSSICAQLGHIMPDAPCYTRLVMLESPRPLVGVGVVFVRDGNVSEHGDEL